jgi:hypothetical protein
MVHRAGDEGPSSDGIGCFDFIVWTVVGLVFILCVIGFIVSLLWVLSLVVK